MEIANIMCSKKDAILIFYSEVSSSLIPVVGTPESEVETYKRRVRGGEGGRKQFFKVGLSRYRHRIAAPSAPPPVVQQ